MDLLALSCITLSFVTAPALSRRYPETSVRATIVSHSHTLASDGFGFGVTHKIADRPCRVFVGVLIEFRNP
jgi:hypothetical protein